jgi:dihydroorotate dehydrogenase
VAPSAQARAAGRRVPLVLKIAPDLAPEDRSTASPTAAIRAHIDALIATNTTLSRKGVENLPHAMKPAA